MPHHPNRRRRHPRPPTRAAMVAGAVAASAALGVTVLSAQPGSASTARLTAQPVSASAGHTPSATSAGAVTRTAAFTRGLHPGTGLRLVARQPAAPLPALRRRLTLAANADPVCRVADGFTRTGDGSLYRVQDSDVLGGAGTMTDLGQVGSGWTGSAFAWIGSGGDDVVYALTWSGALRWYRYDPVAQAWLSGSGRTIGTGFVPRTRITNLAVGGDGSLYVVRANGQLVVYRHTGRLTGAATWASPGGWVIGSGWTGNEIIAPDGDGTLYRQYRGSLLWYRHTDPALGPVTWSGPLVIGTGWRFYDVLPAGDGVLYGTQGGTGQVFAYRHTDPLGGANLWASSDGVLKYTARPDSFGITLDPLACAPPS